MDDNRPNNPNEAREDETIRAMLRSAFARQEEAMHWPPSDLVYSYLTDTATEKQRAEIGMAMRRSSAFRKHVVEIGKAIEELSRAETQARFDAVEVTPLPRGLVENLARRQPVEPPESWLSSTWRSFVEFLGGFQLRRVLVATAAVGVVLVGAYTMRHLWTPAPSVELTRSNDFVDPSDLVGPKPLSPPTHDRDAAIRSVREKVTYTSGELKTVPPTPGDSTQTTGAGRDVAVTLLDASGSKLKEAKFRIPTDATDVQAWVMLLGTRELQKVPVSGDRIEIRLPSDVVEPSGVLTLTYQLDGQFVSTAAEPFESH
jgi:hypothetical protein